MSSSRLCPMKPHVRPPACLPACLPCTRLGLVNVSLSLSLSSLTDTGISSPQRRRSPSEPGGLLTTEAQVEWRSAEESSSGGASLFCGSERVQSTGLNTTCRFGQILTDMEDYSSGRGIKQRREAEQTKQKPGAGGGMSIFIRPQASFPPLTSFCVSLLFIWGAQLPGSAHLRETERQRESESERERERLKEAERERVGA